jgi:hypothetical protein
MKETAMDQFKRFAQSGGSYFVTYTLLVLPTYILPYVGSNSLLAQGVSAEYANATGKSGILIYFLLHLSCLVLLALLARLRGNHIGKGWIVALPIIAAIFDMVPGFSLIPLVPTFLHIGAIVMGVSGKPVGETK